MYISHLFSMNIFLLIPNFLLFQIYIPFLIHTSNQLEKQLFLVKSILIWEKNFTTIQLRLIHKLTILFLYFQNFFSSKVKLIFFFIHFLGKYMKIAHFRWRIQLKPTLTTSFLMAGKISLKKVGKDRLNRSERQREGIFVRSYSESPFLSSSRCSFSAMIRVKTTIPPCFFFSNFTERERERRIWCYGPFDWRI